MPITRQDIIEAINDAIEGLVDEYNEKESAEVDLEVTSLQHATTMWAAEIHGGNVHGTYSITVNLESF